ncbi:DNA-binding transcriptional regulator EnvR [compost metagenome]
MTDHRAKVGAERRQRTRRKLVLTAFRLLAERGIDEPIIDQVIKQAELSRGTFYNHFRSERELFLAVAAEVSVEIIGSVDPIVLRYDNPAVRMACGVTLCVKLARRYPVIAGFLAKGGALAVFAGGSAMQVIGREVVRGREQGLFTVQDMSLAIDLVLGPVLCTFGTLLQREIDADYIRALVRSILLALGLERQQADQVIQVDFGEPEPSQDSIFREL